MRTEGDVSVADDDSGTISNSSTSSTPNAGGSRGRTKRPGLRKVRTGCRTCKIRRIKCDELKPQCRRCLSTGRTCDGYEAVAAAADKSATPSAAALLGPRLLLPRRDNQEIRSYRFFIDVASPSLSGFFYYEFWLREIPRLSQADPAIWHAAVSLGAAYELYSRAAEPDVPTAALSRLVLTQFNQSIQCLVQPSARHSDQARALAASVLFTHISTIRGQHAEAMMHLASSRKLLAELSYATAQTPRPRSRFAPTTDPAASDYAVPQLPVSITATDGIITYFEIQAASIKRGGLLESSDILAASEAFNTWRYYQAPTLGPHEILPSTEQRTAWNAHLVRANMAAESLIYGMIFSAQQNIHLVQRVQVHDDPEAAELIDISERPFLATFRELTKLVRVFERALSLSSLGSGSAPPPLHFLSLLLYMLVIRLLFQNDPDVPDPAVQEKLRAGYFAAILDIAEDMLRRRDTSSYGDAPGPRPPILGPLSLVAHRGTTQALRRRAIALMLAHPERQALSDSIMLARIFEAVLDHEQEKLRQAQGEAGPRGDEDGEQEVPHLSRAFNAVLSFVGERSAIIGSRTWNEAVNGEAGDMHVVHW